jgi:predicted RNase H-like HicB family nuclease
MIPVATYDMKNNASTQHWNPDWNNTASMESLRKFSCHICIIPEDDGTFSAVVLNLLGVGSCGSTEEEAVKNAREAICGVIESYQNHGETIPWCEANGSDIPNVAKQKWIAVNV